MEKPSSFSSAAPERQSFVATPVYSVCRALSAPLHAAAAAQIGGTRSPTTVGGFQHAASPRVSSILVLQSTRSCIAKRKEREWISRDKTCEARGCGAYQSGIEGCHDEWFHREARIARLCMMFMQDGDGVRSVRKVASLRYRLRAPTSEPEAR